MGVSLVAVALAGCNHGVGRQQATLPPQLAYVVGAPYQAAGIWRYPHEDFDADETGLASVNTRVTGLTADGEVADADAMAVAHPTLQLPAIARITNLDTGRQVLVRVNDRGPATRGRLVAVTPRVMQLLGAAGQSTARVRLQVLGDESRQLSAELNGAGAPRLAVTPAPTVAIAAEALAPPPGMRQAALRPPVVRAPGGKPFAAAAAPVIALRLPEMLTQVPPRPGGLFVEAGSFGGLQYAELLRARLAALGAETSTSYDAPRERAYRVRIGPLPSVAAADAVLERTIRAGIGDARIVAE